jgi:hypothetical protein
MRALALALGLALLTVPAAAARAPAGKIAYVHGKRGLLIYIGSALRQPIPLAKTGTPHWSGDGRLVSFGGYIVAGGVQLPTVDLTWAPSGERAAYVTKAGGAGVWTASRGAQVVVPSGWGAQGLAWSNDGSLALGRAVCRGACGRPSQAEIWIWRDGKLHRIVGPLQGDRAPLPFAWHNGRVLWWDWPESGSIAADGVTVYENDRRIADGLMYRDYVDVCGTHIAIAAGGDRYAMHGKRILWDGRDVSRDRSRSWVSPSCVANGRLVAAASANTIPNRIGREHRAIWQLLPTRRQLTRPPAGWTDEYPHLFTNGSLVFVRTRQVPFNKNGEWWTTTRAKLELLSGGVVTELEDLSFTGPDSSGDWLNYYGHYDWPSRLAVSP